jgi:hypothetical protein
LDEQNVGQEWGRERCIQGFGGEPEGKRPLADLPLDGDNTKMDLKDV